MGKKAISVTLRPENLLWLRGQTRAAARRSVSETLAEVIAAARAGGRNRLRAITSVVGSIRIPASDPDLTRADAGIRDLFRPSSAPRRGARIRRAPTRRA